MPHRVTAKKMLLRHGQHFQNMIKLLFSIFDNKMWFKVDKNGLNSVGIQVYDRHTDTYTHRQVSSRGFTYLALKLMVIKQIIRLQKAFFILSLKSCQKDKKNIIYKVLLKKRV